MNQICCFFYTAQYDPLLYLASMPLFSKYVAYILQIFLHVTFKFLKFFVVVVLFFVHFVLVLLLWLFLGLF